MIGPEMFMVLAALPMGWGAARLARHFTRREIPKDWMMVAGTLAIWTIVVLRLPTAAGAAVVASAGCVIATLAVIDGLAFRLPDVLTLPLAVAGLYFGPALTGAPLSAHVGGGLAGYAVLAGLGWLHARLRHRDGIGLGDAKLLAAAGAWLGWRALPSIVLIAAGGGLVIAAIGGLRHGWAGLRRPIPFGVPLGAAFWLVLLETAAA